MAKKNFYVVWNGVKPGVYSNWNDAKAQVEGYEGAIYKSFPNEKDAQNAFNDNPWLHVGKNAEKKKKVSIHNISEIIKDGQLSGELKKEINSHETAVMIVSVIQGAYVLAKAENSTVAFHQAVSGLDNLLNSLKAKN